MATVGLLTLGVDGVVGEGRGVEGVGLGFGLGVGVEVEPPPLCGPLVDVSGLFSVPEPEGDSVSASEPEVESSGCASEGFTSG